MMACAVSACVLCVAVKKRNALKLTFGDADTQLDSPASKRLRLVTDSIDCLADLREQPTKSSTIASSEDKTPEKFKLLFGGSSEEMSQQLLVGGGDDVDSSESDVTADSQSKPSSGSDSSQSECERGKDEDVMTQADEEAMKTYVPLNAGALSYISEDDDDDGNVLDFFLKPPSSSLGTTNCWTVKSTCLHPSVVDAAAADDDDDDGGGGGGRKAVKSSTMLSRTFSVTGDQCSDTGKELVASLLAQEPSASISALNGDDRHFTATAAAQVTDKSTGSNEVSICSTNNASTVAVSAAFVADVRKTVTEGLQDTRRALHQAQSYSQGSDDFRTPASQNLTHLGVIVINGDTTSRSPGSQPLDSDSTVDIGCSPAKNQLQPSAAAGTSPTHFASDGTTTDGWCTPCKSSVPQSPRHRLTDKQPCTSQPRTFDDQSVASRRNLCIELTNTSSSTSQQYVTDAQCMFFTSSASNADGPQSPSLKFTDLHSTGLPQSSSCPVNVQLCRDVTSVSSSMSNDTAAATSRQVVADSYDGDVDSDSDDVISLCVGVRRRRTVGQRLRSRSTSADTVVISSDSDQSQPLLTSRDRSKDGVGRVDVTTVSSGSESDDSVQSVGNEADSRGDFTNNTSAVERSPALFSESST